MIFGTLGQIDVDGNLVESCWAKVTREMMMFKSLMRHGL